ncbi:hypothetical protein Tco_1206171 [Tanacetum coccineum]
MVGAQRFYADMIAFPRSAWNELFDATFPVPTSYEENNFLVQENTFGETETEDAHEHMDKVLKIVDLFQVPNVTEDRLMLRVFPKTMTGQENQ